MYNLASDHELKQSPVDAVAARIPNTLGAALLAVFGVIGLGWLLFCATAGLAQFRLDDAFITYNYARNVAEGAGIRFNATDAQPIEGSSSLLHVGIVAAAIRLGFEPLASTRVVGIVTYLIVPILLAGMVTRLTRVPSTIAILCALTAVGAYAILPETASHLVNGMETLIFTSVNAAAIIWAVSFAAHQHRPGVVAIASGVIVLTLLVTARPEGLVLTVAYLLLIPVLRLALPRRLPWGTISLQWKIVAVAVAGSTAIFLAWKVSYFGSVLPTAYYVKSSNAIFGSSGALLPGFAPVARFLILRFVPMALLVACGAALLRVPWRVIGAVAVALLPVVGVVILYTRAVHESAYEFRYEYPYFLALFGCAALLLAEVWKQSHQRFAWAVILIAAWTPALLRESQPETTQALLGPWREAIRWVTTDYEGDALGKLGRDLGETGLQQRAVISLGGAGQVPYYSRFKAIDWVGLNDLHLSGRVPLTIDEVWQYILAKQPDVLFSVLPPATRGVTDRQQDPAFLARSVQMSVAGQGSELIAHWDRDRVGHMLYREMQFIRDQCEFGAAYALPENWALMAYVRKDSPHRDAILNVLQRSRRADWSLDLTAIYGTDPRTHH